GEIFEKLNSLQLQFGHADFFVVRLTSFISGIKYTCDNIADFINTDTLKEYELPDYREYELWVEDFKTRNYRLFLNLCFSLLEFAKSLKVSISFDSLHYESQKEPNSSLAQRILILKYLEQFGYLNLNKIHQDRTKQAKVISFLFNQSF